MINYGLIWKAIQKKDLLNYVQDTSTFLKIELSRVGRDKGYISNVRGYGTFLGFDVADERIAHSMQRYLQRSGINLMLCGATSFGLRPALTLGAK